jgi:hypothetical protein
MPKIYLVLRLCFLCYDSSTGDDSNNEFDLMLTKLQLHQFSRNQERELPLTVPWMVRVGLENAEIRQDLLSFLGEDHKRRVKSAPQHENEDARIAYIEKRLSQVAGLLVASSMGSECGSYKGKLRSQLATALPYTQIDEMTDDDLPPPPDQDLYAEMLARRRLAMDDLQEALNLFNSEVALKCLDTTPPSELV